MSTQLYVLADQYREAMECLSDLDLPPEAVADTLEGLKGELEVKATNVAMFMRNLEAAAEAIKAAEEQMAKRRKTIENRAASIREYLKMQMDKAGITKIECPYLKLSIKKNPPKVIIDIAEMIPIGFMKEPPPPPKPEPDKKAIAEALKAGTEVPGAYLEQETRLDIS